MPLKVLVELSPSLDAEHWAKAHATGLVPDQVPYGLHQMADEDLSVLVRTPPRGRLVTLLSRAGARLTGGARWPESVLGRPRTAAADVTLCWDERAGIPAVLAHAGGRERRPVITGVIWIAEPDANPAALARRVGKSALGRADAVFVLSSGQIPALCADWGIRADRIHLVHFGVDTNFWDPVLATVGEFSGTGHVNTVVSVGNDRHRDHGSLLAAIRETHRKMPGTRLELVTAAPVEVPQDLGQRHRSVTHPELRDLYYRAQVVAICTKLNTHASGVTAILEAMAMGKTVVTTRMPGIEDYVDHDVTGVLVPVGDPDAVARALVELLADPQRCAELGAAARERALSHFSTRALSGRLAAVVRSVA